MWEFFAIITIPQSHTKINTSAISYGQTTSCTTRLFWASRRAYYTEADLKHRPCLHWSGCWGVNTSYQTFWKIHSPIFLFSILTVPNFSTKHIQNQGSIKQCVCVCVHACLLELPTSLSGLWGSIRVTTCPFLTSIAWESPSQDTVSSSFWISTATPVVPLRRRWQQTNTFSIEVCLQQCT